MHRATPAPLARRGLFSFSQTMFLLFGYLHETAPDKTVRLTPGAGKAKRAFLRAVAGNRNKKRFVHEDSLNDVSYVS
jgi:hypothetical protein